MNTWMVALGIALALLGCGGSNSVGEVRPAPKEPPEAREWRLFQEAYVSFIAAHNQSQRGTRKAAPAGTEVEAVFVPELGSIDALDEPLVRRAYSAWKTLRQDPTTTATIERYRMPYRQVLQRVAEEGLPDVFASVPFVISGYRASGVSPTCGVGLWALTPQVTVAAKQNQGLTLEVSDCSVLQPDGTYSSWNPKEGPRTILADVPAGQDACLISNLALGGASICGTDDRLDSVLSTDFAVRSMAAIWNEEAVRASGMAVEWALLAAGEGVEQSNTISKAYVRWRETTPHQPPHEFIGALLTCEKTSTGNGCTEAQAFKRQPPGQFLVDVLAVHFNAVCVLGAQFSGELPRYEEYRAHYVGEGKLCGPVPSE